MSKIYPFSNLIGNFFQIDRPVRSAWSTRLAGLLACVVLTLCGACGPAVAPSPNDRGGVGTETSALDGERHVTTLAKSQSRRRRGAIVSSRFDAGETESLLPSSIDTARETISPGWAAPTARSITRLVSFASAPFPFDGIIPGGGPFLDVESGDRRGHRTHRGGVLWQDQTFSDDRVLIHIPAGFDPRRQAVMVVFFHGHGATLERDVRDRQKVAEQVSASGANAVLVAPQFAYDAKDSSAGKFWTKHGFRSFLDEAGQRLAAISRSRMSPQIFARMPVVLVAYSGGFLPAARSLKDMGADPRIRGVVLLDALYGEEDEFASWIGASRSAFFVSAYTRSTAARNAGFKGLLAELGMASGTELPASLSRGGVTFVATGAGAIHRDYVTRAWTAFPIKDVLSRLPELYLPDPETTASIAPATGRRSAAAEPR